MLKNSNLSPDTKNAIKFKLTTNAANNTEKKNQTVLATKN